MWWGVVVVVVVPFSEGKWWRTEWQDRGEVQGTGKRRVRGKLSILSFPSTVMMSGECYMFELFSRKRIFLCVFQPNYLHSRMPIFGGFSYVLFYSHAENSMSVFFYEY